ncbi:MAG TPA: acyl-CoA thioesterase [Acetobacteraceae bacterium]|jgi:acyl-CoA thioesterase YciA|nr:acyl-CoA thioesterase [Acetobacteraceae bacterium]
MPTSAIANRTPAGNPIGEPTIRTVAMPADTNPSGDIFGGWLMSQMDIAGGIVAMRRARGRVATVAVDAMTFIAPVAVGDEVSLYAALVGTGRSSIRVFTEAWKRNRYFETFVKVTEGTFVFVAIGEDRRPVPLPPAGDGNDRV